MMCLTKEKTMTFKEYYESLSVRKQARVDKAITRGYFYHLMSGYRKVGWGTYQKLLKIDPKLRYETLRGE